MIDLEGAGSTAEASIYHDDPALGPAEARAGREALMGDIVHLPAGEVVLEGDILAAAPIERVELFNGKELIQTIRPYGEADLGRRIRVLWEGAEYRGRFREVIWDGTARFTGDRISRRPRPSTSSTRTRRWTVSAPTASNGGR